MHIRRKDGICILLKIRFLSLSLSLLGYSGADMANLCREAALGPIRDAAHNIQHISADEVSACDQRVICTCVCYLLLNFRN